MLVCSRVESSSPLRGGNGVDNSASLGGRTRTRTSDGTAVNVGFPKERVRVESKPMLSITGVMSDEESKMSRAGSGSF